MNKKFWTLPLFLCCLVSTAVFPVSLKPAKEAPLAGASSSPAHNLKLLGRASKAQTISSQAYTIGDGFFISIFGAVSTSSTTSSTTTSTATTITTSTTSTTLPPLPSISLKRNGADFVSGSALTAPKSSELDLRLIVTYSLPISVIDISLNDSLLQQVNPQALEVKQSADYELSFNIPSSVLKPADYTLKISVTDSLQRNVQGNYNFTVLAEATALPPDKVTVATPPAGAVTSNPATLNLEIPSVAGTGYLVITTLPPDVRPVATIPVTYEEGKTILSMDLTNRITNEKLSGPYMVSLIYAGKKVWEKTILVPPVK